MGGDQYWESKSNSKYATLISFTKVTMLRDESTVPAELLVPSRNAWRLIETDDQSARKAA